MQNRRQLYSTLVIPCALLLYSCGGDVSLVESCPSGFHGVVSVGIQGFPATVCVLNTDRQGAWKGPWSIPSTGQRGTLTLVLSQQGSDNGSITFADTNQTVALAMLSVTATPISSYASPPMISFQYTYQGQPYIVEGAVVFRADNHLASVNVNAGQDSGAQPPNMPISFDLSGP